MADWIHESCEAMYRDDQAPTAPLREFLEDFDADDNVWWMIGSGHHLNLFESAVEQVEELTQWQREMLQWLFDVPIAMSPADSERLADLRTRAAGPDTPP